MKKLKGIIISILMTITFLFVMPFNIYAYEESVTISASNVIGVYTSSASSSRTTSLSLLLDDNYKGYVTAKIKYTPISGSSSTQNVKFYFYGNTGHGDLSISGEVLSVEFNSIVNQSLVRIIDNKPINYPFESYAPVTYAFQNLEFYSVSEFYNWNFPVFNVPATSRVYEFVCNPNTDYWFIFGTTMSGSFKSTFGLGNCEYVSRSYVTSGAIMSEGTMNWYKVHIKYPEGQSGALNAYITVLKNGLYVPIYQANQKLNNISTDFALIFGLSNPLIEFINGNDNSNTSSDNLSDLASDFTQSSNDVINVENNIGTGFTNALENIPTTFNFQSNFGDKFIHSAQFVRDQFNNLTVGNPFGSLITYSLILGVALLLLGRRLL